MATLRLALALPYKATNNAKAQFERGSAAARDVLTDLAQEIAAVAGGRSISASGQTRPSLKLSIDEQTTAATGTVTCASVQADDTVTVGGITFTAKASPSGTAQWALGADDTACAANLAAKINAHPVTSLYVLASSVLGVVTVTAIGPALGVLGNAIKLTSSNGTRLAVVAMASGADDSTAKTYTF